MKEPKKTKEENKGIASQLIKHHQLIFISLVILLFPSIPFIIANWLSPYEFQTPTSQRFAWQLALALTLVHGVLVAILIYIFREPMRVLIDLDEHRKKNRRGKVRRDRFGLWRLTPLIFWAPLPFIMYLMAAENMLPHIGITHQFQMERPIMAAVTKKRTGPRTSTMHYFLTYDFQPSPKIDQSRFVRISDHNAEDWHSANSRCMHLTARQGLYGALAITKIRFGGCRYPWPVVSQEEINMLQREYSGGVNWARRGGYGESWAGGAELSNPYCEVPKGQNSCAY